MMLWEPERVLLTRLTLLTMAAFVITRRYRTVSCNSSGGEKKKEPKLKKKNEAREHGKKNMMMPYSSSTGTRCTNYGQYHHAQYKEYGFFFCSPCDLYDTVIEKCMVDINPSDTYYTITDTTK
eukprot:scaffold28291_cov36-Attheya_sp.AAC.3